MTDPSRSKACEHTQRAHKRGQSTCPTSRSIGRSLRLSCTSDERINSSVTVRHHKLSHTSVGRCRGVKRSLGASSVSSIDLGERIGENGNRPGSDAATSPPSSQGENSPPRTGDSTALQHDDRASTPSGFRPPQLLPSPPSLGQEGPQTPAPSFRITDYINVTPSPAAPQSPPPASQQPSPSSSSLYPSALGSGAGPSGRYNSTVSVSSPLRKSYDREGMSLGSNLPGRRLFENESGGVGTGASSGCSGNGAERKMHFSESGDRAGSLGSGIDLVQT